MSTSKSQVWELTLQEFQTSIASSSPTPGGGAVTVVSACNGLSLIIMAIEITSKKNDAENLRTINASAHELLKSLSVYADEDIEVFNNYMAAFKLPKETEIQIIERKSALQNCVIDATQVPINAAKKIIEGMRLTKEVIPLIKKSVISDIGAGISLLYGAINGLLLNVDINLPSITDAKTHSEYSEIKKRLKVEALNLYNDTWPEVELILNPQ